MQQYYTFMTITLLYCHTGKRNKMGKIKVLLKGKLSINTKKIELSKEKHYCTSNWETKAFTTWDITGNWLFFYIYINICNYMCLLSKVLKAFMILTSYIITINIFIPNRKRDVGIGCQWQSPESYLPFCSYFKDHIPYICAILCKLTVK